MAERVMETRVENLERRVATVEQILPTLATKTDLAELRIEMKADLQAAVAPLATKAELQAAVAPLATKAELQAAVAPLATKAELQAAVALLATKAELQAAIAPLATKAEVKADIKAEGELTRRHFDVVAEGLRAEIRLIADGYAAMEASNKATRTDIERVLDQHDRRVIRLEASQKRR